MARWAIEYSAAARPAPNTSGRTREATVEREPEEDLLRKRVKKEMMITGGQNSGPRSIS